MKVIILCGGLGYRLREETEFKPKPMVLVGGKPILWHIMKIYAHYGFNEFIIALGYKGDYIKDYFLNQKYLLNDFTLSTKSGTTKLHRRDDGDAKDNFTITFVDTGLESLPGERILRLKEYIPKTDDDFMVTYGDGLSNLNISDLYAFHKKQRTIGTIIGVHPRSKYGLVRKNVHNKVTRLIEKPVLEDWVNGGFMMFKREAFKYFREGEMEHEAFKRLIADKQLSLYQYEGFWYGIDTIKELEEVNEMWNNGNPQWKVWT